jgi:4-amino-4-deoxy-L-arabinose transferase-like glycosyltransferase
MIERGAQTLRPSRAGGWDGPALALGLGLFWLLRLDALPLLDIDEGAFAGASAQLLASGDWGHTTLDGVDRFDKPILVYWLQAAALAIVGPGEVGARLPSAVCAWLWCLALAGFAAPRWGRGVAWAAALLLATALGPALIGRAATADALLNLLLTLAGLDLWRHLESGASAPLRRAAIWVGLGLLAKGPIALLVPGATLLIWAAAERRFAPLRKALGDLPAWLLFFAVSLPWYAYALARHGWAFVDGFLIRHNLARFGGPLEGHGGSLVYYLIALPLLLLPWTPLLIPALRHARRMIDDPLRRFLLAWTGFVLVFFSLSGTKLPHYVLYGVTPLVLLAARGLPLAGERTIGAIAVLGIGMVAVGPTSALLADVITSRLADPFWRLLLEMDELAAPPSWPIAAAVAVVIMMLGIARGAGSMVRVIAICLLAIGYTTQQTLPWWGRALGDPVRELALVARSMAEPVVQWRVHHPSLGFYSGRPAPRREPRAGELAVVRADRLDAGELAALQVLARRRVYLLVRLP